MKDAIFDKAKFFVVGSGFWGATVAERIANVLNETVVVIEKRDHIGGNSASFVDKETGIACHKYGSHIFHTSNKIVWNYVNKFAKFNNYRHKVLTKFKDVVYPMPINLHTINAFYGLNLTPSEARDFIKAEILDANISNPANLEEQSIALIGKPLYEAFVKGYTTKHWGVSPTMLPSSVIKRLPVYYNYQNNYFNDEWQGVPSDGYDALFRNMLSSSNVILKTNTDFFAIKDNIPKEAVVIYTGMLDRFFDYKFGSLKWLSLDFQWEMIDLEDFQGTSVMNYAEERFPFTRIHEFKHYCPEKTDLYNLNKTVICRECSEKFSKGDDAYYPVNDEESQARFLLYGKEAAGHDNLIFGGRLGRYIYWDMDESIEDALLCFKDKLLTKKL